MSKRLLFNTSFITIIISINCTTNIMSSRSKDDIKIEREEFYSQAKPVSRVRHAGNLPLLSASELIGMLDGLNNTIQRIPKNGANFKVYRQLVNLKEQLMFRLQYKLYRPENPNETNDVQMIRRIEVFE